MIEIGGGNGLSVVVSMNGGPSAGAPAQGQVQEFDALMRDAPSRPGEVRPPATPETEGVRGTPTLGEAILNGIQQMREAHQERVRTLDAAVEGKALRMEELLAAQAAVLRLTLEQDLVAKTVSKATQNLDSLLKSQ